MMKSAITVAALGATLALAPASADAQLISASIGGGGYYPAYDYSYTYPAYSYAAPVYSYPSYYAAPAYSYYSYPAYSYYPASTYYYSSSPGLSLSLF